MTRTAAERQAAFRKRMREKGFRLLQVWVDAEGFPGSAAERAGAKKQELTLEQLQEVLVRLTSGTDEAFAPRLYGELAAFAKGVRETWNLSRLNLELFKQKEKKVRGRLPDLY